MSGKRWPVLRVVGHDLDSEPRGTDRDMIDLANIWDEKRFYGELPWPRIEIDGLDPSHKKKTLWVGTSFVWTLTDTLARLEVCGQIDVLSYFKSRARYVDAKGNGWGYPRVPIEELGIDWKQELLQYDSVVLEVPQWCAFELGYGFPEAVLRSFGLWPNR